MDAMQTSPPPSLADGAHVPVAAVTPPLTLPLVGHRYTTVLRTPRHRWWRPPVAWVLAVLLAGVAILVPALVHYIVVLATRGAEEAASAVNADTMGVDVTFVLNISLALLIGVVILSVAVAHPVQSRFLHSVEGRVRWRWLARCVALLAPLWIVYVGVVWWADGSPRQALPDGWPALLAMTFLLTPLQSAGEEYLFRGFVLATIGSWFARPLVGLALATVVSACLFSAAHGSADPWIVLDLVGMSVACMLLVHLTGGLEAAVAVHVVNNVAVGILGILTGTIADSYIDAATQGTPGQAAISVAVTALATVLLLRLARRSGVIAVVPAAVGARP